MPEPKLQVLPQALDIQLSISETPGHYVSKAVATAQPHRLQEIGWRQAGARYSPQPGFMLEQILASPGRLPPHESRSDRAVADVEKALADLPKYASTNERIAKCPRRLLTERGLAGQQLRRGILKGSTIAFITTGYEGKRFIYEKACELGVRSVLVDSADSWSRQLVDEGIAVKFLAIDMSQSSDRLLDFLIEAIRNLEKDPKIGKVDAVATFAELSVPLTARLAEALGVPGPAPESTDQARDKFLTRQALARNGLPTPPVYEILSEQDIDPAIRTVGFPAVLKPVSGAASVGVKKVENEAELWSAYSARHHELGSMVISSGAIIKDDGQQGAAVGASAVIGARFVLESYLDGEEVDVDVVMSDGEWQYAAVSDNGPTLEPYFNETWAVSPSLLPREKQLALRELAVSSVKALGFQDGIFHVELKYTSQHGAQLIEVNARMGGGPVYSTNLKTWGVDLVEETLFCAAGIPSRPVATRKPVECIANADVNALRSGRLVDLSFMKPLLQREGVVSHNCHVREGEEVVGPQDGLPTWLVEVVVSRPTPREALDFLMKLEAEIQALVKLA
ncbi:CARNS1 [Symbiodinium sp. KB8]|nr:CARNS1 [Symbiodinium sp. KB8]